MQCDSRDRNTIKLLVVEEQGILRDAYRSLLPSEPTIDMVGLSGNSDPHVIVKDTRETQPDALLLGVEVLRIDTVHKVQLIRDTFPNIGIVVFYMPYDADGMMQIQSFVRENPTGCAFVSKNSLDNISQLIHLVHAVVVGHVVADPLLVPGMFGAKELVDPSLGGLTQRELEVLSFVARGYRNGPIADELCVDVKTVERHINSIYSKLAEYCEPEHPRVRATLLYLRATGQLARLSGN